MPSTSHRKWTTIRKRSLDAIETIHQKLGAKGKDLAFLRQQVIQGYITQISSQFQGFCRDLYSECLDAFTNALSPKEARPAVRAGFDYGRQLESKNPSPGTLGTDFGRFGLNLWPQLEATNSANKARNKELDLLNHWRNAIAHQDFDKKELKGETTVTLKNAKGWRTTCEELATAIDDLMYAHLQTILNVTPW